MKTLNKVGERGQPCFTPRLIIMGEESSLFAFTTLLVFPYNALIVVRMLLLIPAFSHFFHSRSLGTESKAFLKSTKHA